MPGLTVVVPLMPSQCHRDDTIIVAVVVCRPRCSSGIVVDVVVLVLVLVLVPLRCHGVIVVVVVIAVVVC